jgi:hypothetical protein
METDNFNQKKKNKPDPSDPLDLSDYEDDKNYLSDEENGDPSKQMFNIVKINLKRDTNSDCEDGDDMMED